MIFGPAMEAVEDAVGEPLYRVKCASLIDGGVTYRKGQIVPQAASWPRLEARVRTGRIERVR